ncbi:MAG: hypothetical protein M3388_15450 [Acidobacteriota bacterium]|nr:hypothetical protein [Acidobacteriota bacterium]
MNKEKIENIDELEELPDNWWYRVYLAVIVVTILVISALGIFTRYFSS